MNTRRTNIKLLYAAGQNIGGDVEQFSYTDNASGDADSISASISDRDGAWLGAKCPKKGVLLEATLTAQNVDAEGDDRTLDCGQFTLDSFGHSGLPAVATIGGVAVPADDAFRETSRTATYEAATIEQIAGKIAGKYGLTLHYEGGAIPISAIEQSNQTDCAFLYQLCETYGLAMKVYRKKLVIFDREAYKAKDPVKTLRVTERTGWSIQTDLAGSYTGGTITYTDPDTEEDITVTIGTGPRVLQLNQAASDRADAERIITAAVNAANHAITAVSLSVPGDPFLVASQTVTVTGLGQFSGKYYIKKITHNKGDAYTMTLELVLIEAMTEAAIADACAVLADVSVMNSPDYWVAHVKDINSLDALITNMATRIKANMGGTSIKDPVAACAVLTSAGVMNSPDYWVANYSKLAYLGDLLVKAANALTEG